MNLDKYFQQNPYFSEMGDVIDYQKPRTNWLALPLEDRVVDIQQILSGKRSFGPDFDKAVYMSAQQGVPPEGIAELMVNRERLMKKPVSMGITRKPNLVEILSQNILTPRY